MATQLLQVSDLLEMVLAEYFILIQFYRSVAQMFQHIWSEENIDLWVRPYQIVCLNNDSGLIEPIVSYLTHQVHTLLDLISFSFNYPQLNTVSLHQIKKNSNKSLREYFVDEYGGEDTDEFKSAQRNFVQSCAAYCLISYLLQVKDR